MVALSRCGLGPAKFANRFGASVAWPTIPRVALALLPTQPLRRRTADSDRTASPMRHGAAVREPTTEDHEPNTPTRRAARRRSRIRKRRDRRRAARLGDRRSRRRRLVATVAGRRRGRDGTGGDPGAETPADARQRPTTLSPSPTYTRPADWSPYRPAVHLTPAERWMNDPQRPFWLDGAWHYYYLYNADYPEGNGTEWYHATSTDLVHWREEGVAIEKYANGLGDIETGSAVVDTENTAGFGRGAVIAIMTQQDDGRAAPVALRLDRRRLPLRAVRRQSRDGQPGRDALARPEDRLGRRPRRVAHGARRGPQARLLHVARPEGLDVPLGRSSATTSASSSAPTCSGCHSTATPAKTTWVLAAGVNGAEHGMTTGTAYWTGEWDGEAFTAQAPEPAWLDHGADFYATVTWDDPRLPEPERLASRYAIGWLNNWAYAGDLPTDDWHGGSRLGRARTRAPHRRRPADARLEPGRGALRPRRRGADRRATSRCRTVASTQLPQPASDAYRLRVEVAPDQRDPASEVRFRVKDGDGAFATVGVDFASGVAFVARDADAAAERHARGLPPGAHRTSSRARRRRHPRHHRGRLVGGGVRERRRGRASRISCSVHPARTDSRSNQSAARPTCGCCGSRRSRSRRSSAWIEQLA